MATDKKQNLQDTFLNSVRKSKTPLTIYLVNGVKLQGVVDGTFGQSRSWSADGS